MSNNFRFYMGGVALVASLSLGGCGSIAGPLTDASRIQHIPAITLTEVTQRDGAQKSKNPDQRQSLSVEAWVTSVVEIEGGLKVCDSKDMSAVLCFEKFFEDYPSNKKQAETQDKKKSDLRNHFIVQAITISDVNCSSRIDRVFSVESSGDMFTGIVTKLLGTGGVLASDAATSRAASAAVLGLQTSWDALGESFLAGAQMSAIVSSVKTDRETREKSIYDNMYKPNDNENADRVVNSYSQYSLAEAVRDVIEYDDACDLFK